MGTGLKWLTARFQQPLWRINSTQYTDWGHAVAQLAEALHYKSEDRGFDSRWCHWKFFIDIILPAALCPGVDSVSNRNEYQEYFLEGKSGRCVGLTTLPPSCGDCLESGSLNLLEPFGSSRPLMGLLYPKRNSCKLWIWSRSVIRHPITYLSHQSK